MRSTEWSPRRLAVALVALGTLAAGVAAVGTTVRATYGAQTTADEPQYLLTALSLFDDGDLNIADELSGERWRDFHEAQLPEQTKPLAGGRRVSPHDPLLPMMLAVPMGLGGWVAAKLTMAVLAGVLAALTAWVAIRRFAVSPWTALGVTALLCCSAPLAVYGTQIYPEIPAALATTAGVAALAGPLRTRDRWVLAACVIALPWLAIKYASVAAALAGVAVVRLLRGGRHRQALALTAVLALAGAAFVAAHLAVWGGLTAYASGDHFVGGEFTAVGSSPNYAGRARRLVGLLIDREFGLAAWQPAWLVMIPATALLIRRAPAHWPALATPLIAGWLNATFLALTMHGYWFPGRQIVVVLPLIIIGLAVAADRSRLLLITLAGLGALGVWSYGWLAAEGLGRRITWVVDFDMTADPWYRGWSALLPEYRTMPPGTWLRHGIWIAVLTAVVLLALGLHGRARRGTRGRTRGGAAS